MAKRGRPSRYTEAIANEICERMAGGESLRSICEDEKMPHESTVRHWACIDHDGFFTQFMRARVGQGISCGEQVQEIARDVKAGTMDPRQGDVAAKWMAWAAQRMAPKVYGDGKSIKHEHTHSGQIDHTHKHTTETLLGDLQKIRERRLSKN